MDRWRRVDGEGEQGPSLYKLLKGGSSSPLLQRESLTFQKFLGLPSSHGRAARATFTRLPIPSQQTCAGAPTQASTAAPVLMWA